MLANLVRSACAAGALFLCFLLVPEDVSSQIALTVDPERSLVWWQMDPHFGHLWGTTCPKEPSWQAGEGRSPGFYVNAKNRPSMTKTGKAEEYVPLYPRMTVRPLCRQAVRGTFITADSIAYSGLKGYVVVAADSIATGADVRDEFSRKHAFKSTTFSTIRFQVDSLSGLAQNADTLGAIVHGVFEFRGVQQKIAVPIQVVEHSPGQRVRGKFSMPASALSGTYGVSEVAMGAALGLKLWDTLHFGFDLIVLRAAPAPASSPRTPQPNSAP